MELLPEPEPAGAIDIQDVAEVPCSSALAASEFLTSLQLSHGARETARADAAAAAAEAREAGDSENLTFICVHCGRAARPYCARCLWTGLPMPSPMRLGVRAVIVCHPKEPAVKSSCSSLPLLAPEDVELREWKAPSTARSAEAEAWPPGTWLVFPRRDAVHAVEVDWASVTGLVLIDSRWKHASAVAADPHIAALPAMLLTDKVDSHFWRSATEKLGDSRGLVSTAECLRQILGVRLSCLGSEATGDVDRLDDLLLLFALRLRHIVAEYARDPLRCCPWCTEAARRRCVHEGNARAAARRESRKSIENS